MSKYERTQREIEEITERVRRRARIAMALAYLSMALSIASILVNISGYL